ncbi:MAG: TIGR02147 family protein [Proteobacteria bacterium]|nr:TIGR02147 family protein [Pseudomonadota bacterium]
MQKSPTLIPTRRPDVFHYLEPHRFLRDLATHYKTTRAFSLRSRSEDIKTCSQSLVSQILNGKRQINRKNLFELATFFELTKQEYRTLEDLLTKVKPEVSTPIQQKQDDSLKPVAPKNHLLTYWLNVYLRDLVKLKAFRIDAFHISRMIRGLESPERIKKSCDFLLREGFWRRDQAEKIRAEDPMVVTTIDIPSAKVRKVHKKALAIAFKGIEQFETGTQRKASTTLLVVNETSKHELFSIFDEFHLRLQKFISDHANDGPGEELIQVTCHITPIGQNNPS